MYFKSIELTGFKSFVDHTKISFGKGITAIVGPNGCGKSNISDGIRWVLGEQRAKMLRGAKMEDFIFSGSSSRKQAGMAEVSITIADIGGQISIPELAEYNEVSVTRRLYRSGESEYMINKTPCRLKDVVDLFLDTGISTRAFSIIEQDQVQRIVTSKPEDRRFIIEEAAGIMKYKHKRQAAINKLNSSKANLERVNDIIIELERQKNSLKRQANKAERYKTYKVEMDQLFLATASDEWKNLKSLESSLKDEIKRLEEVRASLETEISTAKNNLISLQNHLDENSREMSLYKEEELGLASTVKNNEEKIGLYKDQISESAGSVVRYESEIDSNRKNAEEMKSQLTEKEKIITGMQDEVSEKKSLLEKKREELSTGQSFVDEVNSRNEELEREIGQIADFVSEKRAGLASDKTKIEMQEKRREKTTAEMDEALESKRLLDLQKEEKVQNKSQLRGNFETLELEKRDLESKIEEVKNLKTEKESAVEKLKTGVTEKSARLESLTEVDKSLEGYQDGIRSLLKLKEDNESLDSKLHGTLLERVKVDKRFETSLELLLGNKLQALLVTKAEDTIEAIDLLHKDNLGRGTFLPIESFTAKKLPEIEKADGVIGHAIDLIETDDEIRPLLSRLLHDVVFVEDIETAISLRSKEDSNGFTFVSVRGDIVDRFGVISGGASGNAGQGILERKRIIEELYKTLDEERAKLQSMTEELGKLTLQLEEYEKKSEEKTNQLKNMELDLVHERKDIEAIDAQIDRYGESIATFRSELESLDSEKVNLMSDIEKLNSEIAGLGEKNASTQKELSELLERKRESIGSIAALSTEISSIDIELTKMEGNFNMALSEKERLETGIAEHIRRVVEMESEIASSTEKKKRLEGEIERLETEIHTSLSRKDDIGGKSRDLSETIEKIREDISEKEDLLKKSDDGLDFTKDTLGDARIKFTEVTGSIRNLAEKIEEHSLTIEDANNYDASGLDIAECQARLAELKDTFSKIGDVNLAAIDDYNQVFERFNFLSTQRDDLLGSINDITKVIDKLNRKTKSLFEETFKQVRENFQVVFKRLFRGGEADMILTDESNILESGIEIMIRPPGKKRQNITLLSAGEKAMTAVSVLFSVFMVMPSPFCLLDEVDAPLDESNIGRFKDILKDFSDTTQFLVITHNQKTMAFADRLYGITMQQPGISQVLSVDMVDTDTVSPEEMHAETA